MHKPNVCGICGGELVENVIPVYEDYSPEIGTIVYENVPVLRCTSCGEEWLSWNLIKRMEEISEGRIRTSKKVKIEVPAFSLASETDYDMSSSRGK